MRALRVDAWSLPKFRSRDEDDGHVPIDPP